MSKLKQVLQQITIWGLAVQVTIFVVDMSATLGTETRARAEHLHKLGRFLQPFDKTECTLLARNATTLCTWDLQMAFVDDELRVTGECGPSVSLMLGDRRPCWYTSPWPSTGGMLKIEWPLALEYEHGDDQSGIFILVLFCFVFGLPCIFATLASISWDLCRLKRLESEAIH